MNDSTRTRSPVSPCPKFGSTVTSNAFALATSRKFSAGYEPVHQIISSFILIVGFFIPVDKVLQDPREICDVTSDRLALFDPLSYGQSFGANQPRINIIPFARCDRGQKCPVGRKLMEIIVSETTWNYRR